MFVAIGRWAVRFRWPIIAVWAVLFLSSAPLVPGVARSLRPGGFGSDDLESTQALMLLSQKLGLSFTGVQVIFASDRLTVDDPAFAAQANAALSSMRDWNLVAQITPYTADPAQISTDRHAAYAAVTLKDEAESLNDLPTEIRSRVTPQPDLRIELAGSPIFYDDILRVSEADLRRAELIAVPFAALALLFVFRSVVAAMLPALVGGMAAAVALAGIFLLARVMPLSIFVLNVATLFGLGLGVDYSLFLVSRFREELDRQPTVDGAVVAAVASAGRALFFSGLTVATGLAAMILFDFSILRSIGIGGVLVVVLAVGSALTLLPAVLSLLGRRVNALPVRLPGWLSRGGEGFWRRLALAVMRRPFAVMIPTILALLALGAPFFSVRLGAPDASILPASSPSRQAFDVLQSRFSATETTPIILAVQANNGSIFDPANVAALYRYIGRIQADPRVERVDSIVSLDPRFSLQQYQVLYANPSRVGDAYVQAAIGALAKDNLAIVRIVSKTPMLDSQSTDLVGALRNSKPAEFSVMVTGGTASIVDYVNTLYHDFPIAIGLIMAVTYAVLLLLFRSVLLPLKAIVMNTFSIGASYGALVFVFQQGHFSNLLGFSALGFVEASIPIMMFCALFGLSMDYEVFLLSRIQETYLQTGDNAHSVAEGLEQSGKIITSAALIVVAVSAAFLSADMILVKALGLGMALAVTLDATLVRGLLVPATMRLLGGLNWWLPRPLGRWLPHIEHEGSVPLAPVKANQ